MREKLHAYLQDLLSIYWSVKPQWISLSDYMDYMDCVSGTGVKQNHRIVHIESHFQILWSWIPFHFQYVQIRHLGLVFFVFFRESGPASTIIETCPVSEYWWGSRFLIPTPLCLNTLFDEFAQNNEGWRLNGFVVIPGKQVGLLGIFCFVFNRKEFIFLMLGI